MIVRGNCQLLDVVLTGELTGALARSLNRGQHELRQHSNDRDDDQEFDERDGRAAVSEPEQA